MVLLGRWSEVHHSHQTASLRVFFQLRFSFWFAVCTHLWARHLSMGSSRLHHMLHTGICLSPEQKIEEWSKISEWKISNFLAVIAGCKAINSSFGNRKPFGYLQGHLDKMGSGSTLAIPLYSSLTWLDPEVVFKHGPGKGQCLKNLGVQLLPWPFLGVSSILHKRKSGLFVFTRSNKAKPSVLGFHCLNDMVVRTRKLMATELEWARVYFA